MTHIIKKPTETPLLEMNDLLRVKKRITNSVTTPISRKSVGVVGDVLISPVSGRVGYVVAFEKEQEMPLLYAEELVKLPPRKPKAETAGVSAVLPKMPDDLKG